MTGTWVPTGAMFGPRFGHTATFLQDGRVLVAGGVDANTVQTAELYDPETDEWTRTGSMHEPRFLHTATLLQDGRVLVAGGYGSSPVLGGFDPPDPGIPVLAAAELYTPATGTWTRAPDMTTSHAEHTATLLPDGRVFIADGNGAVGDGPAITLDTVEWFDPASQAWSFTNRGVPRYGATSTMLADGYLLMFGGAEQDGSQIGRPASHSSTTR